MYFIRPFYHPFHLSLSLSPSHTPSNTFISFVKDLTKYLPYQCDQIWRNGATLAKVYKSLANFWWFISYLAKCWAYFGKFLINWANFHCCRWTNNVKYSNHLVTLIPTYLGIRRCPTQIFDDSSSAAFSSTANLVFQWMKPKRNQVQNTKYK